MSKYDYYKRLKRMLNKEYEIMREETKISRKSTKYYESMITLKTTLADQEHELTNLRQKIEERQHYNETLEKFIQAEEGRVRAIEQNAQQLQKEFERAELEQIEQRNLMMLKMGFIRKIKESTHTCFNMDALPHRLQGVTLHKTESNNEWKPFDIDVKRWMQCIEERLILKQYTESNQSDKDPDKENTTIVI